MTPDAVEEWAKRLETLSQTCAHAFRTAVPQTALMLAPPAFERWAGQGLSLAQKTWRGAECAAWYYRLSPQFLRRLSLEILIQLTQATQRAMEVSPQLGIELLRAAARVVERDQQGRLH